MENLSDETKKILNGSESLFRENEEEITNRMYQIMFDTYPETKSLFKEFRKEQPRVFSAALMFHLLTINYPQDVLLSFRIGACRSHVKAGVQEKHYSMMAESLLKAMKVVLQDKVTDEMINAWEKWFFFVANLLIERERDHYQGKKLLFPEVKV